MRTLKSQIDLMSFDDIPLLLGQELPRPTTAPASDRSRAQQPQGRPPTAPSGGYDAGLKGRMGSGSQGLVFGGSGADQSVRRARPSSPKGNKHKLTPTGGNSPMNRYLG
mmetsp:Transcript_15914/g.24776  ORF Transcript_15914/g.24776 Transcript_15914/m.24776 type:complete len:109 (+) Transcript_15914:132-458(+)